MMTEPLVFAALVNLAIIALFVAMRRLYLAMPIALLNPLLLSIIVVCALLLTLDIDYERFASMSQPLHFFLEVAVVALAYPMYQQLQTIKRYIKLLTIGSFVGVTSATLIAFMLCKLLDVSPQLTATLPALAVTTPITLLVTESLGGIPAIAAVMVILIGMFGAIFGFAMLKLVSVHSLPAQGIAMGVVCHAIGTAAALERNPTVGAFASTAMILSALITAIWVPILYAMLTRLF